MLKELQHNRFILAFFATWLLLGNQSIAKGLDELTPEPPKAESDGGDKESSESTTEETKTANPDTNPTESTEASPKDIQGEASPTNQGAFPPPSSGASQALMDKLILGTNFGFALLSGKMEENGSGMADFWVGYKLPLKLIGSMDSFATFRYAPMDAVLLLDKKSYRGVFESYNFGYFGRFNLSSRWSASGSFELGYMLSHFYPLGSFSTDDKVNASGVNIALGGQADWSFTPKFTLGPRIYLGFGRVNSVQIAGGSTFTF